MTGDFYFEANGVESSEVREASRNSLGAYFNVDPDSRIGASTVAMSARRLLVVGNGRLLQSVQSVWEVLFSVQVDASLEASTRMLLEGLLTSSDAFFDDLLTQLQLASENVTGFQSGAFGQTPPNNVVTEAVAAVEREEVSLVESLLASNSTRTNVSIGGLTMVAEVLDTSSIASSSEPVVVEVNDETSVEVPSSTFAALPVENSAQVVIVVTPMTTVVGSSSTEASNSSETSDSDSNDDGGTTTTVQASLLINIFSSDGSSYSFSGLEEPITFTLTLSDPSEWEQVECAFWDEDIPEWSSEGVSVVARTNTTVTCATTHLSLFGAIVRGFAGTLLCSQASLLTPEGFEELGKGNWFYYPGACVLWAFLAFFIVELILAIRLDLKRMRQKAWSDALFLIPQADMPFELRGGTLNLDTDDVLEEGQLTLLAMVTGCFAELRDFASVFSDVWAEIVDELLGSLLDNFAELRDLCEGVLEAFSEACGSIGSSSGGGGSDLIASVILLTARHAIVKSAHRNACADLGVHHEDEYEEAIAVLERANTVAVEEHADQQDTESNAVRRGSFRSNASCEPEPELTEEEERTRETLRLAAQATSDEVDNNRARSVQFANERQRSNTKLKSSKTTRSFASSASTNTKRTRASESDIRRQQVLQRLHKAHTKRREHHHEHVHKARHMPAAIIRQCVKLGPFGSCLVFSIYAPSSMRVLLLACDVFGGVAVATFFMSVQGSAPSKDNPSECDDPQGIGEMIGRLLMVGVGSGILAVIPCAILHRLHIRRFKPIDYEGSRKYKRQLRRWRVMDVTLWILGIAYLLFCNIFIMLFMANVEEEDQLAWLISGGLSFVDDLFLSPFMVALGPPILAAVLVTMIALYHRESRSETVVRVLALNDPNEDAPADEQLQDNGEQPQGHDAPPQKQARWAASIAEDIPPMPATQADFSEAGNAVGAADTRMSSGRSSEGGDHEVVLFITDTDNSTQVNPLPSHMRMPDMDLQDEASDISEWTDDGTTVMGELQSRDSEATMNLERISMVAEREWGTARPIFIRMSL